MIGRPEVTMLKASTGLEGGVVASGANCGVLLGGALGLALSHEKTLQEKGIPAQAALLAKVGEYQNWFEKSFGAATCRERSGVDFYTSRGQLRYLLPGDKVAKCLWHIRGAMRYLYSFHHEDLSLDSDSEVSGHEPRHCATAVLKGVRDRTGAGDDLLERLAFVFDGGVGLQGGACGALIGAIMGINLVLGLDIRSTSYFKTLKDFGIGHLNLILEKPINTPEPFASGKEVVRSFRETAGATECRPVCGRDFAGWQDFQAHISSSEKCAQLIDLSISLACDALRRTGLVPASAGGEAGTEYAHSQT